MDTPGDENPWALDPDVDEDGLVPPGQPPDLTSGVVWAVGGHLLTFLAPCWTLGVLTRGSEDLDAGESFAAGVGSLLVGAAAQVLLFSVCLAAALAASSRNPQFAKGLAIGWAAGVVLASLMMLMVALGG